MGAGGRVVIAMATVATAAALILHARPERPPPIGVVDAAPDAAHVAMRVGRRMEFSATAENARGFSWFLSGRPVSQQPAWTFLPRSADAGLQQVKVVVSGQDGSRVRREWDVVVETAVAPEVLERTPSGAVISVTEGDTVSFRCAARLPQGGPGDEVTFAWTIDGHPVHRDLQPGAAGASELVVPGARPGMYRVVAHVSEVEEATSLAEWTLVVQPATPVLVARAEPARSVQRTAEPDRRVREAAEPPSGPQPVDLARERHPMAVPDDVVPKEATVAAVSAPATRVAGVDEDEVRRWIDQYAQAWSRKDSEALRRMGHVQTASQTERLRRYFQSVNDIRVDVRVVSLHIDGDGASVDLERTETVTDPSGDRQTLRSPPVHREIERGPEGLRFKDAAKS